MKFNEAQFRKFIEQARFYGANGCRIFPYECKWITRPEDMFSPVRWDYIKKAWNLSDYNEEYFKALDRVVEIAEANNIRIMFSLFDNCQRHRTATNRLYAPWMNNVQGVGLYIESIPLSKQWVSKIVARYGNRMDYEICNECVHWQGTAKTAQWLAAMADHLITLGVPPANICWGAEPIGDYVANKFTLNKDEDLTRNACIILSVKPDPFHPGKAYNDRRNKQTGALAAQDALWCTIHNIGIYPKDGTDERIAVQLWGDAHTRKFIASTDGQSAGSSVMDCEPDGTWRRGDATETHDTCKYLFSHDGGKVGKVTIELLPSNTNPAAWVPGLLGAVKAYKARYGAYPENWGKVPPVEPPVEPPPVTPPVEPKPRKQGVTWQGWLGIGVIIAALAGLAIAFIF
jgi:hypothetical protein